MSDQANATALCCSQFYEQDIVRQLMGDSFHPGGVDLSRRVIQMTGLHADARVLDVACGVGTTASMLANEFGFRTTGVDFSQANVAQAAALHKNAQQQTPAASLPTQQQPTQQQPVEKASGLPVAEACCAPGDPCCQPPNQVSEPTGALDASATSHTSAGTLDFQQGAAASLPFGDHEFDGVFCECAVSTFENQGDVVDELYRVTKPGGIFAMTDMVVNGELPPEIAANIAPWTCVANAHSAPGYQRLFLDHGFVVKHYDDESKGLLELVGQLKRKLLMAGFGKTLGAIPGLDLDIAQMRSLLAEAKQLVENGTVQYASFVFVKPATTSVLIGN